MSSLCAVLLSVACLFNSLAIAIHVWSVWPFRPRLSIKDLRRANCLQSFAESIRDDRRILGEAERIFSRSCAEDENPE